MEVGHPLPVYHGVPLNTSSARALQVGSRDRHLAGGFVHWSFLASVVVCDLTGGRLISFQDL